MKKILLGLILAGFALSSVQPMKRLRDEQEELVLSKQFKTGQEQKLSAFESLSDDILGIVIGILFIDWKNFLPAFPGPKDIKNRIFAVFRLDISKRLKSLMTVPVVARFTGMPEMCLYAYRGSLAEIVECKINHNFLPGRCVFARDPFGNNAYSYVNTELCIDKARLLFYTDERFIAETLENLLRDKEITQEQSKLFYDQRCSEINILNVAANSNESPELLALFEKSLGKLVETNGNIHCNNRNGHFLISVLLGSTFPKELQKLTAFLNKFSAQILKVLPHFLNTLLSCDPVVIQTVFENIPGIVDFCDQEGKTLLALIISYNLPDYYIAGLLECKNFPVNMQDRYGNTLLHYAAERGCGPTIESLINAGANKEIKNNASEIPKDLLTKYIEKKPLVAEILRITESILLQ